MRGLRRCGLRWVGGDGGGWREMEGDGGGWRGMKGIEGEVVEEQDWQITGKLRETRERG